MSYTHTLYHIVLRTKNSERTLRQQNIEALYHYIWGIIKNKSCVLYRINGIEDHIHILTSLHPMFSLSEFVKDIKVASSIWLKQSPDFPLFDGWSEGYAAFTYSLRDKAQISKYIQNQQIHHKGENLHDEWLRMLKEHGIGGSYSVRK